MRTFHFGTLRAVECSSVDNFGLHEVTTLKRRATEILNQLQKDREPILITQHGVPAAYLVDVQTFETLQRRMALLEGIARGEKAIEEGRSLTHKQAKLRMARWLK